MKLDSSKYILWTIFWIVIMRICSTSKNKRAISENNTKNAHGNISIYSKPHATSTIVQQPLKYSLESRNLTILSQETKQEEDSTHIIGVVIFVVIFIIIVILLFCKIPQRVFDSYQKTRANSPY
ncbi:membrane protein RL11N [Cercopithecine betaherpesvirus 5]|uniref:Membrane protein RL11N n=1 Tax=Simian cytomegalovirus (strain Colburn) TaxID=50292 RepID=G8XT80_SCMVC|nr:membrane protein RL11N [Cercopithecine betaherpesvirus 5]AEV80373.1 membrane protein RL11N [Cercopithecine betaherpesvirus 5]